MLRTIKGIGFRNYIKYIFVFLLLLGFVLWLNGIFQEGTDSAQFAIFFRGMRDFWADYLNPVGYSAEADPYNNEIYANLGHKQQPPLTYVFANLISKFSVKMDEYYADNNFLDMYTEPLFLFVSVIFIVIIFITIFELIKSNVEGNSFFKFATALAVTLSFPCLYALERGNNFLVTSIFIMLYFFNYKKDNYVLRELALIALAIAFGLKLIPAIFGIFLLYEKRWFDAVRCAIYGLIALMIPFCFLEGGTDNWNFFLRNLQLSTENHSVFDGASIIGSIVYFLEDVLGVTLGEEAECTLLIGNYILCVLLVIFSFYYKYTWQKALVIALVSVSVSGQAGTYSLLVFIPFLIDLLNEKKDMWVVSLIAFIAALVIFTPFRLGMAIWEPRVAILVLTLLMVIVGIVDMVIGLRKGDANG